MTLDQRAFTPEQLERHARRRQGGGGADRRRGGRARSSWKRIWQIDPMPFDDELVELAAQAVGEVTGDEDPPRLPSGALHDCAEVARRAPAVMVFSVLHRRRQPLARRGHAGGRPAGRAAGLRAALRVDRGDDLRAVGGSASRPGPRSSGRRSTRRRRSPPGRAASRRSARPSRSREKRSQISSGTNEPCAAPTREWSL